MAGIEDHVQRIEAYCQEGLITERLPSGIFIYRASNMKRATIDVWYAAVSAHDTLAYANRAHICSIIDIRQAGWPTPYAITMANKSAQNTPPDLEESMVVLVADTIGFRMVEIMVRKLTSKARHATRIMRDETDAIEWLQERIELLKHD